MNKITLECSIYRNQWCSNSWGFFVVFRFTSGTQALAARIERRNTERSENLIDQPVIMEVILFEA